MRSRADRRARSLSMTAVLIAVAATLGYAESVLLPPMPVPGIRIGIANVAVVVALAWIGARGALSVSLARVFVVGLATGALGGPATLMALSGACAAWLVMSLLARRGDSFSPMGWSVAGAAAHVLAQLGAASALTGSAAPWALAPLALALALGAGIATGALSSAIVARTPHLLSRPLAQLIAGGTGEAMRSAAPADGV